MTARLGLGDLVRAGRRAVSKYTGTVLAVFVVQSLVAAACMFGVAVVLAQELAHLPMFDDAVDGDLVSLIWCVRHATPAFSAATGIVLGALLFWQLATWFLVGGLAGVFAREPEGRGDTARCFGASGVATYLAYVRLALCALPGLVITLFVLAVGFALMRDRIEHALAVPQLLGALAVATLPALLLFHLFATVTDYARVELALRHDSHAPSAVLTYLRTFVWVVRRPLTLVHAGLGWVAFWLVTLAYVYLAHGHPMYGAEGAVTLFFVRQGVALLRMAIAIGVIGGQVELGRTRPLPPRRIEVKAETKAG